MNTVQTAMNNIFCEYQQIGYDVYQCKNCGAVIQTIEGQSPPIFPCSHTLVKKDKDTGGISFGDKILNFAKSVAQHTCNGFPTCTPEQIEKRHSICLKCEFLKDNTCTKCGCPISRTRQFISKLAWADQECPIGKWKKEI